MTCDLKIRHRKDTTIENPQDGCSILLSIERILLPWAMVLRMLPQYRCLVLLLLYFVVLWTPSPAACFAVHWGRPPPNRRPSILRTENTPSGDETAEITEIVVHKVKETIGHTGAMTTLYVLVERFVERMERFRSIERVTERTLERMGERSWERFGERVGERSLERFGERSLERFGERSLERFGERSLERFGERSLKRVGERSLERVGERSLERIGERSLERFLERRFLGLSLGRLALRLGRSLTIALPLFGGLFALYLFRGDVVRWQEERRQRIHRRPQNNSWKSSSTIALAFLFGTGATDFLDAVLHFWMAYGIWVAHHPHHIHDDWREIASIWCAVLSTVFAICGEICSHRSSIRQEHPATTD